MELMKSGLEISIKGEILMAAQDNQKTKLNHDNNKENRCSVHQSGNHHYF